MSTELKTLNGYGFDATKLGGLDAQYYAQGRAAHNLLDNSDFTNPVNQRGATTATLGKYFIDRWITEPYPSGPSITIDSNGLTLLPTTSSTAGIYQILPDYENRKGKVHTFAICVNNVWKCVSFTMGNFGVGYQIHGLYFFSVNKQNILLRNNKSDNPVPITIQRVALYEGAYTAETLPAYVPKGKHVEMLNCNVPLAPHNLLDNSDFRNPVNQRGATSYSSQGYSIDRWKSEIAGGTSFSISVSSGKLIISKSGGIFRFYQILNNGMLGKTVTYAVKTSDGIFSGTCVVSNTTNDVRIGSHNAYLSVYDNGSTIFSIFFDDSSDDTIEIYCAALYEGAYDASTLPAYQPKGYAAELAECQRYYLPLNNQLLGSGYTFSDGAALLVPRKMRIDAPSFVASGTIRARVNGADYSLTLSSVATYKSMIKVDFACDNIPMNYPCAFYENASDVSLNADL